MKILQINKFFYVRGGSERYYFGLCDLLRSHGHQVLHFSMRHPRNQSSQQHQYFMSEIDFNAPMGLLDRMRAAARLLYSTEAKERLGRLIDDEKPDIIHFHNISRQLSPSMISAALSRGVPMVQTLHDLSLVCPAHTFFFDDRPCEECAGGAYWHAIPKRCIDESLGSTLLGVVEAYLHAWTGLYARISKFIAPSRFLKGKVETLKWIRGKTAHLPYFIPPGPDYTAENSGYVLFTGRICREKGVATLVGAAKRLPRARFVIAGEGPDLADLKRVASGEALTNVEFVGYLEGRDLEERLKACSCVAVPSQWYENLPLSILEAFARGKPVVATDSGGISELVMDGRTGYLVRPGDPDSLAAGLKKALGDEALRSKMGRQARQMILDHYSPEQHYETLMSIYEGVLTCA